jgi:hypothetical protein
MPKLLSTAYMPPVSYFAAMAEEMDGLSNRRDGDSSIELTPSVIYIEACENYQKQSYRNRCRFMAADGPQALSYSIVHTGGTHKLPISEIRIDWSTPWLQQHERAIVSAYRTSAYFEYYPDELFAIMESRPERLIDFNMALLRFFIEKTGLAIDLRLTEDFSSVTSCVDLREAIHPKRPNSILKDLNLEKPYFQVFARKHGFQSDLSIMDLLFNEGPDSILYLKTL